MKKNNKTPKPIKEVTQEWWSDLPMSDRYKFAHEKVWQETADWKKEFITGSGNDERHEKEFLKEVILFAESDQIKWN